MQAMCDRPLLIEGSFFNDDRGQMRFVNNFKMEDDFEIGGERYLVFKQK